MDKVYLLLRNNQQTGPYTYEELLQQQLLPTDLIWVEGKSTAWVYPSELASLIARPTKIKAAGPEAVTNAGRSTVTQNTPQEAPWYLHRKSPEAELEERALALRERAQAAAAQTQRPNASIAPHQPRHRTIYREEESPVLLEVHTINKKSVSLPQLIAAGVITALVAAGWYNREVLNIVRPQQNTVTQAAAPAVFQVSLPAPPLPAVAAVADTTPAEPRDSVATVLATTPIAAARPKPVKKQVEAPIVITNETSVAQPPLVQTATTEKKEPATTDTATDRKAPEKKDTAEATVAQSGTEAEVEAAPQKKKGLGQALKNIFKKKKKNEDKVAENNTDTE